MSQLCGVCVCVNWRLVDQLHCALKAKNVIIEQLEAEKADAMTEASQQFELKIAELNDKLQAFQTADANVSLLHRWAVTISN